jgi:hypothetical protein
MEAPAAIVDAASPLADAELFGNHGWMQPAGNRRQWTIALIIGAIALVFVLVICVAGGAAGFLAWRSTADSSPSVTADATSIPSVSPTPSPSPSPSPSPLTPAACLIGDWRENTATTNSEIFGVSVQLTGGGATVHFTTAGENVLRLENVVMAGKANGDSYEVIHNGTLTMNYEATDTTIHYSNPRASGNTTWKVNGKTRDTEPLKGTLKPQTYSCKGDQLRLYGQTGADELTRIKP